MQPTSSSAHTTSVSPNRPIGPNIAHASTGPTRNGNSHSNAYATALRTNIERLVPLEMMRIRQSEVAHAVIPAGRKAVAVPFAGVMNSTSGANNTNSASAAQPARKAKSTPDDIDFLCAVASRDLIAQTVADIRKPGVWNEHLLDVLLALKRKQPELLGASNVRVVASNLIPSHMALLTHSQRANKVRDPMEITTSRGPASASTPELATNAPANHRANVQADNASGHLSFVHDAQHYHIVNTKEAFFRAIISVREEIDPVAVSKQNIDALIEDTADFLEDHWRENYRLVWTKMAKSAAT